jgi:hypothetical protein
MNSHAFSLGLAGHTHRFETFLNEGDNWFGRNDFDHEQDWLRDVPFPGYPLHVQTSALGKEEHLGARLPDSLRAGGTADVERLAAELETLEEPRGRGIFGDDIGWRWVQVENDEVAFFTADTDGDGYRNTEDPWLLGELLFTLEEPGDGSVISSVENHHHETWSDVRHYVPADPATAYEVTGGTLIRRLPDGTAVVGVETVAPQATSTVVLTPTPATVEATPDGPTNHPSLSLANPTCPPATIRYELPGIARVRLRIHDVVGRPVRTLVDAVQPAGPHEVTWDGRNQRGEAVAAGVYLCQLSVGDKRQTRRTVLLRSFHTH